MDSTVLITDLPDEIITQILNNATYNDIVSFGMTCKQFHNIVINDQSLWKSKCIELLPSCIFNTIQQHFENKNWRKELRTFVQVKKDAVNYLLQMSPKFFWRMNPLQMVDIVDFFKIAIKHELTYYYVLHIMQNIIQKSFTMLERMVCEKPYTLTEVHYAKIIVRFFMHIFLSIKWIKLYKTDLWPEVVINFCIQWIDPANTYGDENINEVLNQIVDDVKYVIQQNHSKKEQIKLEDVTEREKISAISHVIYNQRRITLSPAASIDNLNIVKVIQNKCGHVITLAVIYQAVARRCGVKIMLVAFSNHLYLEWIDTRETQHSNSYTVSLDTGELKPKRRCPYSHGTQGANYLYCPDSLVQYIYSSYLITMGAIRNWNTQNALHLLDFLGAGHSYQNPYKHFFHYLVDIPELRNPNNILDLCNMSQFYRDVVMALFTLNTAVEPVTHNYALKKHDSKVLYAVGMICYHKKYEYICIVRGWDLDGDHVEVPVDSLQFGRKQPFYRVTAADQSERYVAQENLIQLTHPNRLYHLEDQISKEFTHFDGFAYVLNDEKKLEYPEEGPIIEMYRINSLVMRA